MREECEWSEWYDPAVRLPPIGAYVQLDASCGWCNKAEIQEGIVVRMDKEKDQYALAPEVRPFCANYVKKWRERIIKIGDDIEDAEVIEDQPKIPEMV